MTMNDKELSELRKRVEGYFNADPIDLIEREQIAKGGDYYKDNCEGESFRKFPIADFETFTGMEFLGSGCYARVYAISDEYALKIVKTDDKGYEKFVRACKRDPNNPYLPKIQGPFTWGEKTCYVLERLKPIDEDDFDTFINILGIIEDTNNGFMQGAIQVKDENLRRVAHLGRAEDLHGDNVMSRNGHPVITDPYSVAGYSSTESNHCKCPDCAEKMADIEYAVCKRI